MKGLSISSLALGLTAGLLLAACQPAAGPATDTRASAPKTETMEARPPFENIDASTFREKMHAANTVILDVRTPAETQAGMIEGAIALDINQADFQEKVGQLDKEKTYLVYCQSGGRSSRACEIMAEMGFDSLFNLKGGFSTW